MKGFLLAMLLITAGIGVAMLLLLAIQIGLKRVYGLVPDGSKKKLQFVKTISEADTWQLFGICAMIAMVVYWWSI